MRMRFPWDDSDIWMLPGGGIETGENPVQACVREVWEETGLSVPDDTPEIWHREFYVEKAKTHVKQNYYLVNTAKFQPVPAALTNDESKAFREFKWWTVAEIETSTERFEPPTLAQGIKMVGKHGIPPTPINTDEIT